jgi:hypothetical protein
MQHQTKSLQTPGGGGVLKDAREEANELDRVLYEALKKDPKQTKLMPFELL